MPYAEQQMAHVTLEILYSLLAAEKQESMTSEKGIR